MSNARPPGVPLIRSVRQRRRASRPPSLTDRWPHGGHTPRSFPGAPIGPAPRCKAAAQPTRLLDAARDQPGRGGHRCRRAGSPAARRGLMRGLVSEYASDPVDEYVVGTPWALPLTPPLARRRRRRLSRRSRRPRSRAPRGAEAEAISGADSDSGATATHGRSRARVPVAGADSGSGSGIGLGQNGGGSGSGLVVAVEVAGTGVRCGEFVGWGLSGGGGCCGRSARWSTGWLV